MDNNEDAFGMMLDSKIDPEVMKIIHPKWYHKVARFFNKIVSHISYKLGFKKV